MLKILQRKALRDLQAVLRKHNMHISFYVHSIETGIGDFPEPRIELIHTPTKEVLFTSIGYWTLTPQDT